MICALLTSPLCALGTTRQGRLDLEWPQPRSQCLFLMHLPCRLLLLVCFKDCALPSSSIPPYPLLGAGVCGRGQRAEGCGAGASLSGNHIFWLLPRSDRPDDLLGDLVNAVKTQPWVLFTILILSQVFDATNTTRERRHMILNFAKENDFKVSQTSCLALECSGERRTPRSQLIYTWSFSSCCPGFAHVDRAFLVLASRVTTKGGGCVGISVGQGLEIE